jgi:hypothetical protein
MYHYRERERERERDKEVIYATLFSFITLLAQVQKALQRYFGKC